MSVITNTSQLINDSNFAATDGGQTFTSAIWNGTAIDDGYISSAAAWNAKGNAFVASPLSQFAATTSAQLLGVISDSTGSGLLVFGTSPTLITPILGTPTSGNLANCTFPTFNQNTSGSAATLTTARTISGTGEATFTTTSFNGSVNVSGAVTLLNSAVIGKVLTGYVSGAGTVAATDTILEAIQKLNGNILLNGNGTVTIVSVTTANGISGVVATNTTTPAITLTLGAITPTSVNGLTITATTGVLTIAAGKTLTTLKTISFNAADDTGVYTLPTGAKTLLATDGNGSALTGLTSSQVGLGNVTNESKATMFTNATFTGTFAVAAGSIANAALANGAVANLSGTNTGDNAVNTLYSGLVSNATHTGEVTGATALTLDKTGITNKTNVTAAVGDSILISDLSDTDNLKKVTIQSIVDLTTPSLKTKAITKVLGDFTGNPRKATVTFATPFADANYSISIVGVDDRNWSFESKVAGSFVINANSNTDLTGSVTIIAIKTGEN